MSDPAKDLVKDLEERILTPEEIAAIPENIVTVNGELVDISQYLAERAGIFSLNPFKKVADEVKERHALKAALGRRAYNRFYIETVLKTIKDEYNKAVAPEVLEEINKMVADDRFSIPAYETVMDENTFTTRNEGGGLYTVEIFLPKGIKLRNFVKKFPSKKNFNRAVEVQRRLSDLTINQKVPIGDSYGYTHKSKKLDLVSAPRYADRSNLILAEPLFEGQTLNEAVKNDALSTTSLLENVIDCWTVLVKEATKATGSRGGFRDHKGNDLLTTIDYSRGIIDKFILPATSPKIRKRWREDKELSHLADLYAEEIGEPLNLSEKTFVHGDLHTKNILINSSETKFIDLEGAAYTLPQFDLTRLLSSALVYDEREERKLVDYAFDNLHYYDTRRLEAELEQFKKAGSEMAERLEKELEENLASKTGREEAKEKFWQDYLKTRAGSDIVSAVRLLREKVPNSEEDMKEYANLAHLLFNRAVETVKNDRLKQKLREAGSRLYAIPAIADPVEKLQALAMQKKNLLYSVGTTTQLFMFENNMRNDRWKKRTVRALKTGLPTAALLIGAGLGIAKYVDHAQTEAIKEAEIGKYAQIVKIEQRAEPITIDETFNITADYPLIYDPTISPEERADNLESPLVKPFTMARAEAFTGSGRDLCGPGDRPECWQRHDPIHSYGSRDTYGHIDQDMVRALLLTSEWMNSRGTDGYWGDRRWGIQTSVCNSPVIYYNGKALPLTRCGQLQETEGNILATYRRLSDMLAAHPQIEDAIANLFGGDDLVDEFKKKTEEDDYWRYSSHPEFPQEVRDFVGAFMVIYPQVRGI